MANKTFIKSTVTSVCPSDSITPFGFACNGKIWPFLAKSADADFGFDSKLIVLHLSVADIAVVVSINDIENAHDHNDMNI